MMTYAAENKHKKTVIEELFAREKVSVPDFEFVYPENAWNYRNKMEYSFWGDDDGIHLALHQRGSHGKQIVQGSKLALPAIDKGAAAICEQLTKLGTRAGDLKTIIVRSDQQGTAVASLFTKLEQFTELTLPKELKGLRVYHSDPRSPASVPTRLLYELGDPLLEDRLLDKPFVYDVDSFFQVNVEIFERALRSIKEHITETEVTDMYAGVGTIGLSVATDKVDLIELDPATVRMASHNASNVAEQMVVNVVETSTEKALEYITGDMPVIFDPPRAGLHDKVVARVLEVLPDKVIYLSCNPSTQARDLAKLQEKYLIEFFEVYNFFPRTPHIESLAVLRIK
jgi:23S rRNA (uracil1939-C5)-methyltransferase